MGKYVATPSLDASSQADSDSDALNVYFDDISIQSGDIATLPGPLERQCVALVFDLTQGGGIAKTSVIRDVTLTVKPLITQSLSGGDAQHRLALMEPNGQWDRSVDSPLHQSNGGIVYGAPSRSLTSRSFRGEDQLGATIFDTSTAAAGFTTFETSAAWPSWGCTFNLPANKSLFNIYCHMARLDSGSASKVTISIYELAGDGRQFAVKSLLGNSHWRFYNGLILNTMTEEPFSFYGQPIFATSSDRWLAAVITGEIWDDGTIKTTHRLKHRVVLEHVSDRYRAATEGSLFKVSDVEVNDNALNDIAYPYSSDIPHIYDSGTTSVLTTPYSRVWTDGNVLESADSTVAWTSGVSYKYGSLAGSNIFAGIVDEFQGWLNSDNFDPANGKHHIGILLEPFDPDDSVWPIEAATVTLTIGFANSTNVRADSETRSRIFVATEVRDRTRPRKTQTGARIRAPSSFCRSQR